MKIGLQLYPPRTAPEMAAFAEKALRGYPFDVIWVPDHLTYENVFVILAAIATRTGAHIGTSVTHPWARTPVDLASSFAALSHLAGPNGITVGIGAGSPSSNMILKRNRVGMAREMILFLREMFAGNKVALGDFPRLAEFYRLDPKAVGFLRMPPATPPPILIAAAGPQMLKMAWEAGDGLIVSNLSFPTALVRLGALEVAMSEFEKKRHERDPDRPFAKVLHLHISVARDGAAAKHFAKAMAAGALIQGHLLKLRMLKLPVPAAITNRVIAAQREGQSLESMIGLIDDALLSRIGTVIAGTPEECIAGIDEMLRAAKPYRFSNVDIASPLGPDWDEALELICREIIPAINSNLAAYS